VREVTLQHYIRMLKGGAASSVWNRSLKVTKSRLTKIFSTRGGRRKRERPRGDILTTCKKLRERVELYEKLVWPSRGLLFTLQKMRSRVDRDKIRGRRKPATRARRGNIKSGRAWVKGESTRSCCPARVVRWKGTLLDDQ